MSYLKINYYNDYKYYIKRYILKEALKKIYKLRGVSILNNCYYKLLNFKLYNYKDTTNYIEGFKEIYNNITKIYNELDLNKNFLIFLFYTRLEKEYKTYFI